MPLQTSIAEGFFALDTPFRGSDPDRAEWLPGRDGSYHGPHLLDSGVAIDQRCATSSNWWCNRNRSGRLGSRQLGLSSEDSHGAWEGRLAFAHEREAVVSQKRNELEATVQLLSNQTTANATAQEIAATTQRVMLVARELASANSALSKALISRP